MASVEDNVQNEEFLGNMHLIGRCFYLHDYLLVVYPKYVLVNVPNRHPFKNLINETSGKSYSIVAVHLNRISIFVSRYHRDELSCVVSESLHRVPAEVAQGRHAARVLRRTAIRARAQGGEGCVHLWGVHYLLVSYSDVSR